KLNATQVASHTGEMPARHSFVSVTPRDVVLTAMKKAEDSNALIFHLYEWAGKSGNITISVPPGATGATETNLMELPQGPALPVTDNKVTVPVRPFEIVAVRVDYPHHS
ncbi:MAG: glycosyl hydrolase-related protein, partial [Acidobacteriaceae bacterium]